MLNKAINIASIAFENTFDKSDKPYILHLLYVMNKVEFLGETAMICAVLHDLIEDKKHLGYDTTYLKNAGFSDEIIDIIKLLTHEDNISYMDYIANLSTNFIASSIKKEDLKHNMQLSRLKKLTQKDFERFNKYCKALQYLLNK